MLLLISLKTLLILKTCVRRYSEESPAVYQLKPGLGDAWDEDSQSFSLLNRRNVTWVLPPPADCDHSVKLALIISSGPKNRELRHKWRSQVKTHTDIRAVFLVAQPVGDDSEHVQESLQQEHDQHGDIVQAGVEDGHRKLGYKILSGYVWTHLHCPGAVLVGKTDDNVELELELMMTGVRKMESERSIMCGSGTPHRNMKPLRSDRTHMTGNWSISRDQVEADYHPDFCCGFLYLTTPSVGAELVQAGAVLYGDTEVEQIEDSLITGELRVRLENVIITGTGPLHSSLLSSFWSSTLSHCPWLSLTKLAFSNNLVRSKSSSRKNVQYVGPINSPQLWRYYICLHIEFVLENLEKMAPDFAPQFIFDLCKR